MGKIIMCMLAVLAIIYVVPFVVYGIFSAVAGLKPPEGASPLQFLISVFVIKVGTAIAFVWIFYAARGSLSGQWLLFALIWWVAAVIGEAGQAIGPNYTWMEAVAGIISETVYFPLAAFVTNWMVGLN